MVGAVGVGTLAHMLELDQTLTGRYRVEALLGSGGMAQVYRGTDTVLSRSVAIKVLSSDYSRDSAFVERFRREARAAARLNHPTVVSVYDTGSDDGVHFIQMWVLPDTERVTPGYEQLDLNGELDRGGLHPIASGAGHDAAISLRQKDAVLWGGRLKPGETVSVPDGRNVHLFVAVGEVGLEGAGPLVAGDAVRLQGAGSPKLTAGPAGAETLIWVTA